MVECKKCGMCFRDNYGLSRHMSRVKPCSIKNEKMIFIKEKNDEQKELFDEQKELSGEQKELSGEQKELSGEQKELCVFCMTTFYNNSSLKRHQKICKLKDDPIRLLEIKNQIKVKFPESKNECRFCNKILYNTSKLNSHLKFCKKREDYHGSLLKQPEQTLINYGTINNNTNNIQNNIIVLNFGSENLDNIKVEDIMNDVYEVIGNNSDANNYIMAGKLLTRFEERVKENPENKNTKLRSLTSNYGEIKTSTGTKKVKLKKFLENCIKNTARNFNIKKKEIKTKDRETNSIFNEVDTYAKNGFEINNEEILDKNELELIKENNIDYQYVLINEN